MRTGNVKTVDNQQNLAKGTADARVAEAEGARRAAFQQAKAYQAHPTQRDIDRIRAFCGPDGCDPRVVGGSLSA